MIRLVKWCWSWGARNRFSDTGRNQSGRLNSNRSWDVSSLYKINVEHNSALHSLNSQCDKFVANVTHEEIDWTIFMYLYSNWNVTGCKPMNKGGTTVVLNFIKRIRASRIDYQVCYVEPTKFLVSYVVAGCVIFFWKVWRYCLLALLMKTRKHIIKNTSVWQLK